jgi:hypothetical protein
VYIAAPEISAPATAAATGLIVVITQGLHPAAP